MPKKRAAPRKPADRVERSVTEFARVQMSARKLSVFRRRSQAIRLGFGFTSSTGKLYRLNKETAGPDLSECANGAKPR